MLIQAIYLSLAVIINQTKNNEQEKENFMTNHIYTMKIIPLAILTIGFFSIVYNGIAWIVEIRRSSPIQKAKFWFILLTCDDEKISFTLKPTMNGSSSYRISGENIVMVNHKQQDIKETESNNQ